MLLVDAFSSLHGFAKERLLAANNPFAPSFPSETARTSVLDVVWSPFEGF